MVENKTSEDVWASETYVSHFTEQRINRQKKPLAALLWDYCDLCISLRNWQAVKSVVEEDALSKGGVNVNHDIPV